MGIKVDPLKIEAIEKCEAPKTPTEIRSFLELAGYYRKFIQDFSPIATPLAALTTKNVRFKWKEEQAKAFQRLKDKLCSEPIPSLLNGTKDFMVYSDASKLGLGKANVILDTLSRKERSGTIKAIALRVALLTSIQDELQRFQSEVVRENKIKKERLGGVIFELVKGGRELLSFQCRVWVPSYGDLRECILSEANKSRNGITLLWIS
ncbi:uncharacterized protein LOC112506124 [Cynara cardunculus var. scolymus]|uniref:uncharacterized protein LOC112506124 n=1 Tax=Cynara cardunculus var. scolymus TaxID=59895 RepID=UPI000D62489A|nr:uncharacterized protein LOC112506124 [Cynara cardunculus var. scolymus]